MKVSEIINKLVSRSKEEPRFNLHIDRDGLNFVLPQETFDACAKGEGSMWLLNQFVCLQMLEEQNLAYRIANGFTVRSEDAVHLEADVRPLLELPPKFEGAFETRVSGQTGQSAFTVKIIPVLPSGEKVPLYQLKGPCLQLSEKEIYLLPPSHFAALHAVEAHKGLAPEHKDEHRNLKLVGELQEAKRQGAAIDLSHFNKLHIAQPEKVGVTAAEQQDGSLLLTPSFGTGAKPDDIQKRLGQLQGKEEGGTLRVRDQIVVLNEERLRATQEILENKHIPKAQVREFLTNPSAFLDAALVDLDTGFSLRVQGAARFQFMPFGETDASGIDWFKAMESSVDLTKLREVILSAEDLADFRQRLSTAQEQGAEEVVFAGQAFNIMEPEAIETELAEAEKAIRGEPAGEAASEESEDEGKEAEKAERSTVSIIEPDEADQQLHALADQIYDSPINFSKYLRQPYPHQVEGIRWFLGLASHVVRGKNQNIEKDVKAVRGALMADDMGLGKTYMALVGINELYELLKEANLTQKPILIVAPLSLLETWDDETKQTFAKSPFRDIVMLQANRDLKRYTITGATPETRQNFGDQEVLEEDAIRYALKIGSLYGSKRLDIPQRLVLTTYQTLRDYQFSLCKVDWSIVVFDEAQNIKNQNALQTRAAKGLKADFKLLATGTPVENSLADFWCLMHTAQPDLLGNWPQFRERYVRPINRAEDTLVDEVRIEVGQNLRRDVGRFMLRRLKEDSLEGLPRKRIYCGVESAPEGWVFKPEIASQMQGEQLNCYDQVLADYAKRREASQKKGMALVALQQLQKVSLHPGLLDYEQDLLSRTEYDASTMLGQSAKLRDIVSLLEEIQARQEKVIIFAISKKLQRAIKIWFGKVFATSIDIINGDSKAIATQRDTLTRKKMISNFEEKAGFAILIMSPIAAGVGLTIIGANNVIHLERHWNPAKEAQATDRVYRIGQKKDVNIYLPVSHHPGQQSFDVNLDRLLQKKTNLKDAVVTPQVVTAEDMGGAFQFS